jgi:hypothetical protein
MNDPDFDPLLTDLVADSDFNRFRGELKKRALTRFRRHQAWRRIRRTGAAVVLIAVAALTILRFPERADRVNCDGFHLISARLRLLRR